MAKRSRRRRKHSRRRRRRRGAGLLSSTRRAPRACLRAVGNFLNRSCKLDKFAFPTTREKAAKCFADDAMSEQREEGRQPTAADRQQALQGARELLREIEKDHQCIEQPVGVDGAPLYHLGARPTSDPAADHMERQLAAFHGLSGGRRTRRRRRRRRTRRRRRSRRSRRGGVPKATTRKTKELLKKRKERRRQGYGTAPAAAAAAVPPPPALKSSSRPRRKADRMPREWWQPPRSDEEARRARDEYEALAWFTWTESFDWRPPGPWPTYLVPEDLTRAHERYRPVPVGVHRSDANRDRAIAHYIDQLRATYPDAEYQ